MGNRAVITDTSKQIGVYLHWNGGYDSVSAFCEYARLKGVPAPSNDCASDYAWARFCQIVGNFLGGTGSLGVGLYRRMDKDNGDNGVYIVGADWKIVKREYMRGAEQRNYDRAEMLEAIDNAQPEKERLGKAFLTTEAVPVGEIKIGDVVAYLDPVHETPRFALVKPTKDRFTADIVPGIALNEKDPDYLSELDSVKWYGFRRVTDAEKLAEIRKRGAELEAKAE